MFKVKRSFISGLSPFFSAPKCLKRRSRMSAPLPNAVNEKNPKREKNFSVSDPLFFFTDTDPDPTQKPKADPDPDPGEILHAYNDK